MKITKVLNFFLVFFILFLLILEQLLNQTIALDNNPYNNDVSISVKNKVEKITSFFKEKKEILSEEEYNNLLELFFTKTEDLNNKNINNKSVQNLILYMIYEIKNIDILDISNSPFAILGLDPNRNDIEFAKDLNIHWTRAHGVEGLKWDIVEKEGPLGNSEYDWTNSDELLKSFKENNIEIIWTINPYNAIDQGDTSIKSRGSTKLPNDLDAYVKFLKAAVERYDGDGYNDVDGSYTVKYWQIHNEINVDKFFWDDTPENYALLLKTSYDALKSVDSEAKVAIGGMSNPGGISEGDNNYNAIIEELKKINGTFDIFDVHWYGFVGNYKQHDKGTKETLVNFLENSLPELLEGLDDVKEIWMTEVGTHSGEDVIGNQKYPDQTEEEQAIELLKRYVYPVVHGVKRIFWNSLLESASYSREFKQNDYFDNIGIIHNGCGYDEEFKCDFENGIGSDLGENVKKLSYYSYKLMVEKLEGSDWDNIEIIQESDNIYIYKLKNLNTNKYIWIAWNDNNEEKNISLSINDIKSVIITEAVPDYDNGKSVLDYNNSFKTEIKDVNNEILSIELNQKPVFIEKYSEINQNNENNNGCVWQKPIKNLKIACSNSDLSTTPGKYFETIGDNCECGSQLYEIKCIDDELNEDSECFGRWSCGKYNQYCK